MTKDSPLLSVRNLRTYFYTYSGVVKALDGVHLDIYRNEIVGLVGETGCGKSLTALSIIQLVDRPGKIVDGEIWFKGENLLKKSEKEMRKARGKDITMVFQDPTTYLNPVYTIGEQIGEAIKLHQGSTEDKNRKSVLNRKVIEVLKLVGMPDPERIAKRYPHELSTGMRQRAMIGMMISCNPDLLVADEATTALDVTVQAQILELLTKLAKQLNTSILIITHDLGIIAETCNRVYVMYAGNIVESAETKELFDNPLHPYTSGLLKAVPALNSSTKRLETIPGFVPNLISPPSGCRFHPRCPHKMPICVEKNPPNVKVGPDHYVSCHLIKARTMENKRGWV
jgi:oligopeptide/dipeptide ABC transporter ATP-binding protein